MPRGARSARVHRGEVRGCSHHRLERGERRLGRAVRAHEPVAVLDVVAVALVPRGVPEQRAGERPAVPRRRSTRAATRPGSASLTDRGPRVGAPTSVPQIFFAPSPKLDHQVVERSVWRNAFVGSGDGRPVRVLVRVVRDRVEVRAAAELVDAAEERERRDLAVARRARGRGRRSSRSRPGRPRGSRVDARRSSSVYATGSGRGPQNGTWFGSFQISQWCTPSGAYRCAATRTKLGVRARGRSARTRLRDTRAPSPTGRRAHRRRRPRARGCSAPCTTRSVPVQS